MTAAANQQEPFHIPRPESIKPTGKPVTLRDMIYFAANEGREIDREIEACLKVGLPVHEEMIFRAEVFATIARLLNRIEPVLKQVIALLNSVDKKAKR